MASTDTNIPFSQRTGVEHIPEQLKLGEVSAQLRRLLDYSVALEIDREEVSGYYGGHFTGRWLRVAKDLHVRFFGRSASSHKNSSYELKQFLERFFERENIGKMFDLVEFLVCHPGCSDQLKCDFTEAFVSARAAYRIIDAQILAIGTEQQADAFKAAIEATEAIGAVAARSHLIKSGAALRSGDWPGSVRESIHAVEAMAVRLAPGTDTLGKALNQLEQLGHLHGGLKKAFGNLYGYTSDEKGVRHASVFTEDAQVDEADALFMLGACASFVSYLIARSSGS